jgi:Xaa-Pro aminopeptidase
LREIKTKEELDLMRKAISFTCDGIKEAMKALEPGMGEYDVEAIVEYVFKSKGSEDVGYPSIIGGGENSCILHYETNRKKLVSKDMVVCDVGAEYHGYTADVTRTIPVSGKFSPEQKAIYNIVLEAQLAGIAKCKPGEYFRAPHNAAMEIIQKRLLELGIIKAPSEVMKYFFHGTSHYLGLDVHDAGTYGKLLPNSVITVEPGIYIPEGSDCDPKWWNIGIRIEDDILITDTEPEVLSSCVPKKIEEIEVLMKKESLFNLLKK